jgi:hypothetical protein
VNREPRELDAIYRDILTIARRRAHEASFRSDRMREQTESRHASLIPALLCCDDVRRHRHYLDVEKVRFAPACACARSRLSGDFEPLWRELEEAVSHAFPSIPLARAAAAMPLDYRQPATHHGSG